MRLSMGRLGLVLAAAGVLTIGSGAAGVYAQSTATVVMQEFSFTPSRIAVSAGRDTFALQNSGRFPHNVHIEGNGVSVDVKPDGPVAGGDSFSGAVMLPPGTYDIWCPVGSHRDQGMVGTLTVAGAGQPPTALPRTGEAGTGLPVAPAGIMGGLLLLGTGWLVRRRAMTRR